MKKYNKKPVILFPDDEEIEWYDEEEDLELIDSVSRLKPK